MSLPADDLRYALPESDRRKRLLGAHIINLLPYPVYKQLVGFIKRNRKVTAFDIAPPVQAGTGKVTVWLTQDIDTVGCWSGLPALLDMQSQHGFTSTTHFLTRGPYKLQQSLLDDMQARGFEIGLHGTTHDSAIGFRSDRAMRAHIARGLNDLQCSAKSYRAPALGISEELLNVLSETGFRVDSSVPMRLFYRHGVASHRPYMYPGTNMVEVPIAMQDVNLISDMRLADDEAMAVFKTILQCLKPVSGTFIFNAHPVHIMKRPALYKSMLALLANDPDVIVIRNSDQISA